MKHGLISPEDWTILKESLPQDYSLKPGTLLKAQLKFFTSILDGTLNIKEFCDNHRKKMKDIRKYCDLLSSLSTEEEKIEAILAILDSNYINSEIKDTLLIHKDLLIKIKNKT